MQAGVGLLILDVICLYNDHYLHIVMIIWSSINCPTVICSPTICYFSREKPLVKSTAPRSLLYYICLRDLFYLLLFSDLLNQKYKNTLLQFILIYFIWRSIYQSTIILFASVCYLGAPLPERDWQPLLHVGLRVFFICVQVSFMLCCLVLLLVR